MSAMLTLLREASIIPSCAFLAPIYVSATYRGNLLRWQGPKIAHPRDSGQAADSVAVKAYPLDDKCARRQADMTPLVGLVAV
jgi:hypothetical protein